MFRSITIFVGFLGASFALLEKSHAFAHKKSPTRREFMEKVTFSFNKIVATSALSWNRGFSSSCFASRGDSPSSSLIELIPRMEFDAPATNATLPTALSARIEELTDMLEKSFTSSRNLAKDPNLSGSWRLLYSNAPEITNLANGLPLGFALGPTYQPIDTTSGRFENRGKVLNRLSLAKLQTNVIGDISVAKDGTLNAIGVKNERGNRVNVDFRCIIFELDEVLGVPVGPLRKIIVPKVTANVARPANDITYLDYMTRVVRGGDGSLFIFTREESGTQMLTLHERDLLLKLKEKNNVIIGAGEEFNQKQPELNFLLKK